MKIDSAEFTKTIDELSNFRELYCLREKLKQKPLFKSNVDELLRRVRISCTTPCSQGKVDSP